ncbi:L-ascorbate oxidase homolog [Linum perenne]
METTAFFFFLVLCSFSVLVRAGNPVRNFDWTVTYGEIRPLGVKQQGILINGEFPGPSIEAVTNDNLIINVHNNLNEPFLISWSGIQNRKNSYVDGVYGTTCPIPPGKNYTYKLQAKDQIGTYYYFPSLAFHKAAGGFGAINVLSRPMIPVPFDPPADDITLLVGDWYTTNHKVLKAKLDGGHKLGHPHGILINGHGPRSPPTLTFQSGKTYRLRITNVGLQNSINFRIQGHSNLKLVEVEGTHTVQTMYSSLDVHVGQSVSVLVTADQPAKDYKIVFSTRFTSKVISSAAILHYQGANGVATTQLPMLPNQISWSLKQALSIRTNASASAARPNPQGSYHYGQVNISRTIILTTAPAQVDGKQRYGVNGVSFVHGNTPLKLADHFNISGVFKAGSIPYTPPDHPRKLHLDSSVMEADYRSFVEIVIQNREKIVQTWHINGHSFWVAGMDLGTWKPESRRGYNLNDAVSRYTVQVYPRSWTAIFVALDNVGMWNVRTEYWQRQYLGEQFYLRVFTDSNSLRDEYLMPEHSLLCGKAKDKKIKPIKH